MSQTDKSHSYAHTLTMPENRMPMKVSQPSLESELLARWQKDGLYQKLRAASSGRTKFVLHDGPPYANGQIHLGHALNKVLKDAVVRSRQMTGYDAALVPGWDCHGLPIEWKVEEQYRDAGRSKDDVGVVEFRRECREFASHWQGVQSAEFERLGVSADFANPYLTMNYEAEAMIAAELMKLVETGQVYQGSKPVMWSVVERTALAEAEVEHLPYESETAWVKFPVAAGAEDLLDAHVVVWTTTPWTLPANRALAYSGRVDYALYEVGNPQREFGPRSGERYLLATDLHAAVAEKGKFDLTFLRTVSTVELDEVSCRHPLSDLGYDFAVPMLEGDHVTATVGTGFVHTAPGHGAEDFDLWVKSRVKLASLGVDARIPFTVDDAGFLTDEAYGFGPSSVGGAARVLDDQGKRGDANDRVFKALIDAGVLVARAKVKHSYPHSWRSKKPVLFRNTPQWFVHMDKPLDDGRTLRARAREAMDEVTFVPEAGRNRLAAMLDGRPDWVLSRQRRWGVPVTVFCDQSGQVLVDPLANEKVVAAFREDGADAWFTEGARDRFLSHRDDADRWLMVHDILDVWFDSGCTHAFVLEGRGDQRSPADVYLEGSDQHRGWFQHSLLESCATRGTSPFKAVVTHGFVLGEDGLKMAKSGKNGVSPQKVVEEYGADVLRLWALTADFRDDVKVGPKSLQVTRDAFRKLRNTLRWMEGMLSHHNGMSHKHEVLPELEKLMLHRVSQLDVQVRTAYDEYDFKKVVRLLFDFMNVELSAFYFDARKDALYCDGADSLRKQAALQVVSELFNHLTVWLAPLLPFMCEEAWQAVHGGVNSVHMQQFPVVPTSWSDEKLASKWGKVFEVRDLVNACLEVERKAGRLGKNLEASPEVFVARDEYHSALQNVELETVFGTSGVLVTVGQSENSAFTVDWLQGVSVMYRPALGQKCARSWVVRPDVGSDPDYPGVSLRDAHALRQWYGKAA